MRGRRPKPTALKIISGKPGHRPLPHAEPKPPIIDSLDPPKNLSDNARKQWRILAPQLKTLGLLTELDIPMFVRLCQNLALNSEAWEKLGQIGVMVRGPQKTVMISPYERIIDRTEKRLAKLWEHFGMSPTSRARLHIEKPEAPSKQDARFFGTSG